MDRELPRLIYGTAWKEERTEALTIQALRVGARAIDTANQRKHYVEAAVGRAIAGSGIPRDQLFIQTKFTFARGQDHRLPYDPNAAIAEQVRQSFASSCEHLGVEILDLPPHSLLGSAAHPGRAGVIDSYVLHGPWSSHGWSTEDREAWQAMEDLHRAGLIRYLGISNTSAEQLQLIVDNARIAPRFVQNRCYARTGWDRAVRAVCDRHHIRYQAFSLLTANRNELANPTLAAIGARHGLSPEQTVFAFATTAGMIPLTGTSSEDHLRADLAAISVTLEPDELRELEAISG